MDPDNLGFLIGLCAPFICFLGIFLCIVCNSSKKKNGMILREGAPKQMNRIGPTPQSSQPSIFPSGPPQLQRQSPTPLPMYYPGIARTQSSPSATTPPIVFVPVHPAQANMLPPPPSNNMPTAREISVSKSSPSDTPVKALRLTSPHAKSKSSKIGQTPKVQEKDSPAIPPDAIVIHPLPPLGGKGRLNKRKKKKRRDTTSSSSSSDSSVGTETEKTQGDDDGGILSTSTMKKEKKRRKKHKHRKRRSKSREKKRKR
uniref:Uncharacterized protein n=1 Tax=Meloidogyne hapla TaxID=6305 RepID=A0A1I8BAP9_MELHA